MGIFRDLTKDFGNKEASQLAAVRQIESTRDHATLQAVHSCVMVADQDNVIVKLNPSALKLMQSVEKDIQKFLPHFDANKLVGEKIDVFHRNPQHQTDFLKNLDSTTQSRIKIGERSFDLTLSPMFDEERKRMGTVLEWQDVTQALRQEETELAAAQKEQKLMAEMSRIKSALDSTSTNVMIADAENTIVYANDSVLEMLKSNEDELRKELPNFRADELIGANVDVFHKQPAHQQKMLAGLSSTVKTKIVVGEKHFSLILNPVKDEDGKRLGTVVEWVDLVSEILFERAVNTVIQSALEGNLEDRIEPHPSCNDSIKAAVQGINQLLDMFSNLLNDAGSTVKKLAEGKLTEKMSGDYKGSFGELQNDINKTIDKLVAVVTEIAEASFSVQESSTEISNGNNDLSRRTEQQAASLEETSSAMEEITATVQQNAENSIQANTLARGAREAAENGGTVVGRAVSAMQAISESSRKINDIIGVIDEIAFQTNLLALNAAVEAARAGDQGRGFAVVADEVRSLAGRSATAAKEIKELIKDSSDKVNEGSELVNQSGGTLDEIVTAVKKVNDIVAEIATASDEQSTGLGEISRAITEMDDMTQQNAALVEEAAAASESMSSQAGNLDQLISFFVTGIKRKTASPVIPSSKSSAPARPATSSKAAEPVKAQASTSEPVKAEPKPEVKMETAAPSKAVAEKPVTPPEDEGDEWEVF